jgi:pimeloyl-ACP methyl ester carboxylesterase
MVRGIRTCGVDSRFDLVLTYDYENLSTPIADTSRALKAQLAAAGLHEGDGRRLTVLAHSMGGLVSRWFIEREGGKAVVDHLVMCGTPNSGSPLGRIDAARKVLNVLMTVALNYLPGAVPFAGTVVMLLNRSKKLTPTLEQMNPSSEFIATLNSSEDPGIPYTVLAGDVDEYRDPGDPLFGRLLTKAGQGFVASALFSQQAHDIAVGVESILSVPDKRRVSASRTNVACHHLNYFVSEPGQTALRAVHWGAVVEA